MIHRAIPTGRVERSNTNCFDFLRVLSALAVLYSHSFALIGKPEPQPIAGQSFGSLAVAVFFAISGFLVCQSWARDSSPWRFAGRRALRILPGLLIVILFTAILVGPLFTTISWQAYFGAKATWSYIPRTFLFLAVPPLPGLFDSNPYPTVNNGSLWTLRYEVLMYAWLAMVGTLLPKTHLKTACSLSFFGFSILWIVLLFYDKIPLQIPFIWRLGTELYVDRIASLGAYFFAGCCIHLFFNKIRLSLLVAGLLIAFSILAPNKNLVMPILWIAIPYATITFAYRGPIFLQKLSGFDYSYGIYIYAFPVQQVLVQLIPNSRENWHTTLAASIVVTSLLAAASWHVVERPFMGLKKWLTPTNMLASCVPPSKTA